LPGYEIGQFSCVDQDEADTHRFSLIDSASNVFSLDEDTGVLTVSTEVVIFLSTEVVLLFEY
jgi:hypothetical protein